ncbi:MAG TPA: ABC transporter ATP-binding protein [Anaeromyxobacteraceae bacterium]|nr:ABC transporter ATP-binding protein [Anaeromyxobacteraceae bacterium]
MTRPEALLATERISRRFGGLSAVKDVSIALRRGEVHALLGPNGAGKSTLINLLSGDLAASAGRVLYGGRDVTDFSVERRARAGIGRSYQKTNVFMAFTAFENCRLAAQSRRPRAWHVLADATAHLSHREVAERALAAAGLEGRGPRIAATLSHGEQRQLEVAMVLATEPKVLLLDEPLAGMGPEEAERMVELLARIAPAHAILLVEHDMDAAFALAHVVTVMVEGEVLESGPPEQIRASPAVSRAYLGVDGAPGPGEARAGEGRG